MDSLLRPVRHARRRSGRWRFPAAEAGTTGLQTARLLHKARRAFIDAVGMRQRSGGSAWLERKRWAERRASTALVVSSPSAGGASRRPLPRRNSKGGTRSRLVRMIEGNGRRSAVRAIGSPGRAGRERPPSGVGCDIKTTRDELKRFRSLASHAGATVPVARSDLGKRSRQCPPATANLARWSFAAR